MSCEHVHKNRATYSIGEADFASSTIDIGCSSMPFLPNNHISETSHHMLARYAQEESLELIKRFVGMQAIWKRDVSCA